MPNIFFEEQQKKYLSCNLNGDMTAVYFRRVKKYLNDREREREWVVQLASFLMEFQLWKIMSLKLNGFKGSSWSVIH